MLWSTDGHYYPESFLLAVLQMREGLKKVLTEYVDRGTLTVRQAVKLVEDLLFNTANDLYDLGLKLKPLVVTTQYPLRKSVSVKQPPATHDIGLLENFLMQNPSVKFLRLQWLDYTATARVRLLPVKQALKMFRAAKYIGVSKAALGLLQTDVACEGFSATGQYDLVPAFDSLLISNRPQYATMQCEFRENDGTEGDLCSRTVLRRQVEKGSAMGINFTVGYEIEVVFMTRKFDGDHIVFGERPVTLEGGHAWSAVRALHDKDIMNLVETIVIDLEKAGIELLQFHPETAPGQVCPFPILQDPFYPFSLCGEQGSEDIKASSYPLLNVVVREETLQRWLLKYFYS